MLKETIISTKSKTKRIKNIWNPLCTSQDETPREYGHSTLGFITPCCWCDPVFKLKGEKLFDDLYTEDLKISNNDSIEDILLSDPWLRWYESIENGPENAPSTCKRYCYRSHETHKKIKVSKQFGNGTKQN